MSKLEITIIFLVVENEKPLWVNSEPSPALVWKKALIVSGVDTWIDTNPDWCYDRIVEFDPELANHTIAIWAVDKEPEADGTPYSIKLSMEDY